MTSLLFTPMKATAKAIATLSVLMVTLSPVAHSAESHKVELHPYEASYSANLSNIPVNGSATRTLVRNSDGSWSLTFKADMFVYSFSEESRFRLEAGYIQPEYYNMEKGALGRKKSAEINFDWSKKIAKSRENDDRWDVPLQTSDLDRISYQQQLQLDVVNGLKDFHYKVIDEDSRDQYTFRIDGEEVLETPLGRLNTVRLAMVRKNNKRQTLIWLARDWNDLLVQLKQTEKGKDYLVSVKSATVGNKVVTGIKPAASQ